MDKDVTGLAVERAARTLGRVKELFNKRVPYGPTRVRMSPVEARRMIQGLSPDAKSRMIMNMGLDKWTELMTELYNGRI